VPEGVAVARWMLQVATGVRAFYDIDTPVTLGKLRRADHEYIAPDLVPRFDLYLSFAGGRALSVLAHQFGARRPRPLYCSVDPDVHRTRAEPRRWDLGYMGTFSPDRQPGLEVLLLAPARACPRAPSQSPGRNTRRTSSGRRTCNASSTCRRRDMPPSMARSGSR
jgi:spore maturation protein CgeB